LRRLENQPPCFKSAQGNQGNFRLREAIVRHIALTRAVSARPQDALVTAGAQQAFDLLARTLVTPGKTVVAIEDPGYPPMRVAFAAAGATIVPVEVDEEGLVVDQHHLRLPVAPIPDRRHDVGAAPHCLGGIRPCQWRGDRRGRL